MSSAFVRENSSQSRFFLLGYAACKTGTPKFMCPYDYMTWPREQWIEGYETAMMEQ